jgi:hypothetical protein
MQIILYVLFLLLTVTPMHDSSSDSGVRRIEAKNLPPKDTHPKSNILRQDTLSQREPLKHESATDMQGVLMVFGTWVLAAVSIWQTMISRKAAKRQFEQTAMLIKASQDQLRMSDAMTQRELRAYVSIRAVPKIQLAKVIGETVCS